MHDKMQIFMQTAIRRWDSRKRGGKVDDIKESYEERQYVQTMHTEDFKKAVLSAAWLFENMREMILHKESFRTEIRYNAEAKNVEIETFAPKESLQDDNSQEC